MSGAPAAPARESAYADTNIIVALLSGSTHASHAEALDLFRRVAFGELILLVPSVVVAELTYVLGRGAGWSRADLVGRLRAMFDTVGIELVERAAIARALDLYEGHGRLDFADAYIGAMALEQGPATVASFDHDFDLIDGVRRIAA